ncbi:MAG: hypothetical protein SWY16_19585 [Cyanobacteriota bacterium]|nr:hypothetical protein [Cyanobacteriota bacterium]
MIDSLQETQIAALNHKIEGLYEAIEHLSLQISGLLAKQKICERSEGETSSLGARGSRHHAGEMSLLSSLMEHKDVILDGNTLEIGNQNGEKILSPEVQIQRLTAQLTAAYNRIAALEEQLLARRTH